MFVEVLSSGGRVRHPAHEGKVELGRGLGNPGKEIQPSLLVLLKKMASGSVTGCKPINQDLAEKLKASDKTGAQPICNFWLFHRTAEQQFNSDAWFQ